MRPGPCCGGILAAMAVAGCGGALPQVAPSPISTRPASPPPETKAARERAADARIVSVLIHELSGDPWLSRERLAIFCDSGIVTLEGTVRSKLAKDRAPRVAHVVRGVRAVIDRVAVAREPRGAHPKIALEIDVAGALARDPVTARQPIAAREQDGVVHLTGEVDSIATRRAAEQDALALPGIHAVNSDLAVQRARRTDSALAAEAERMLKDDPWVDATRIHAAADHGAVVLTGTAGSWVEKARAETDVRATSPDGVSAGTLRVVQRPDDGTLRSQSAQEATDAEMTRALVDSYARDPRLGSFLPEIDVRYGAVVLTGVAPTPEAAIAAEEDARNISGVHCTRVALRTWTNADASDPAVLYNVRRAIDNDAGLAPRHLNVEVWHGRIVLRGTVANPSDRLHAIAIASSTLGARAVEDMLLIAAPTLHRR
ncbi:MAG: BON domain-containing protein [Polyangiaceae bacterium]